jgi:hypothetical protein
VTGFGPGGLEGKLVTGPFRDPADAILCTPGGRNFAVHLQADGTFKTGSADVLPPEQFLAGETAVLTDRQQRRQDLYRVLLQRPGEGRLAGRPVLLAWARPADLHFHLADDARLAGDALLVVPLRLRRPEPGKSVTVPGELLTYQNFRDVGNAVLPDLSGVPLTRQQITRNTDLHLRFQVPPELLPFKVEKARLVARVVAPSRRVTVSGRDGERLVEIKRVDSPAGPLEVALTEARFLNLDADGGLHLNLDIHSNRDAREPCSIQYLELEITGHAE